MIKVSANESGDYHTSVSIRIITLCPYLFQKDAFCTSVFAAAFSSTHFESVIMVDKANHFMLPYELRSDLVLF